MPYTDLSTGVRLYYDEIVNDEIVNGSTPLILVHGLLGTAELNFKNVIEWLGDTYHVYGPTLRGFGKSQPPSRDFPPNFYQMDADDVLAFMDALKIEKAHILGYSDGGEVALLAAAKAPERFYSVMTIGAVGYFGPAMRPIVQGYFPGEWIDEKEREVHGIKDTGAFILPWIQSVKAIIDSGGDLSLSQAHKINVPLLMMLGDTDRLNPQEYGQRFIDRTPQGKLVMFKAGHPVHDQAWDEFKRVVGEFLAQFE